MKFSNLVRKILQQENCLIAYRLQNAKNRINYVYSGLFFYSIQKNQYDNMGYDKDKYGKLTHVTLIPFWLGNLK